MDTSSMGETSYMEHILAYFPINADHVIWAYILFIAFEGHYDGGTFFCNSMVDKCCSLFLFDGCM